jgi:hypothetical protein
VGIDRLRGARGALLRARRETVAVAGDDGRVREQREPEALRRVLLLALGAASLRDEVLERRAAGGAEGRQGERGRHRGPDPCHRDHDA